MWYFETVKLDLEARRLIERLTDSDPHAYRLPANPIKSRSPIHPK